MSENILINVFENPFNTDVKSHYQFTKSIRIDTFLLTFFGKNYVNKKLKITLNGTIVDKQNYDYVLNGNDICNIFTELEGDIGTKAIGAVVNFFSPAQAPELDLPENLYNIDQKKSKNYDPRLSSNIARLGETIPNQYGKIKWYPDLASAPYIRHENNTAVVRYLLCLGHGEHELNDIFFGKTSVLNNTDVSTVLHTPNVSFTRFDDNVLTLKEIQNVNINSGSRSQIYEPYDVVFDKSAKTITFNTATPLNYKLYFARRNFVEDDEIRIFHETNTDYNGVFEIDTIQDGVNTVQSVITLKDVTAWASSGATLQNVSIWKTSDIENNPFYHIKNSSGNDIALPYFVKNTFTKTFIIDNFYKDDFNLEIDYNTPQQLGVYDTSGIIYTESNPFVNAGGYLVPIDSSGAEITVHYKLYYDRILSSNSSTEYQASASFRDWKNNSDLTNINFPTIKNPTFNNDFYFSENGLPIDNTDINTIDYTNGIVTFNTAKIGTIKAHNVIFLKNYTYQPIQSTFGRWITTIGRVINESITKSEYFNNLQKNSLFQGQTLEYNVYSKYKCILYNDKGLAGFWTEISDQVKIKRIKVKYPNIKFYGDKSLLSVEITNTNEDNNFELNDLSVITTRKLNIYNGTTWSTPTATRSIAWGLADVWMSYYGGNRSYADLDLDKLLSLDTTWTSRGDTFDGIFDSSSSIFEAISKIARVGRCKPYYFNEVLSFVRDEAQTTRKAMFNSNNILPDSFKINYTFSDLDTPNGILINYIDENNNYEPSQLKSNSNATKYQEVDFFGCVNYEQAWRESQYLQKKLLKLKKTINFSTEMIGHNLLIYDRVAISFDLPNWGQGGQIKSKNGTTITTYEPLNFTGSSPFYMLFQKPNGDVSGLHEVTQGATEYEAILVADVTDFSFITDLNYKNPTIYNFGNTNNYAKDLIITKITPKDNNQFFDIECVEYIDDVYTADTGTPPAQTQPIELMNQATIPSSLVPKVSGLKLTNVAGSGSVVAIWNKTNNINTYKVQKSTDNQTWVDVSTPTTETETISATGTLYVRVACVILSVVGEYSKKVLIAS